MSAPAKVRRDYRIDGEKVPGTTTIIGGNLGWSKDPLMWWAWNEGMHGRDFRQTRDRAADAGTLGHALIEARILGNSVDALLAGAVIAEEGKAKAERALEAFVEFSEAHAFEVVGTEVEIVSKTHRYGGTLDILARFDGRLVVLDVKTGKSVHDDMAIQLAAYRHLWNETRVTASSRIDDAVILHVSAETAEFAIHEFPSAKLDAAMEAFKHLRALHDLKGEICAPRKRKPKKVAA